MTHSLLEKEIAKAKAKTKANNAYCASMMRAISASKAELEIEKRKTRRSVKTNARLITHPMPIEKHKADLQVKALRARDAAEVEAQKATEEALREARIQEEIRTRTFTGEPNIFFTIQRLKFCQSLCRPTSGRTTSLPSPVRLASRQAALSTSSRHS
jgi:multidrug efflux pump subunit AcrA (membrane-fusion protein)